MQVLTHVGGGQRQVFEAGPEIGAQLLLGGTVHETETVLVYIDLDGLWSVRGRRAVTCGKHQKPT